MTKEEYRAYLQSDEWRYKRMKVFDRDMNTCKICGKRAEQVHHITYENVGDEPLDDLVSLCKDCHQLITALVKITENMLKNEIGQTKYEVVIHKKVNSTFSDLKYEFRGVTSKALSKSVVTYLYKRNLICGPHELKSILAEIEKVFIPTLLAKYKYPGEWMAEALKCSDNHIVQSFLDTIDISEMMAMVRNCVYLNPGRKESAPTNGLKQYNYTMFASQEEGEGFEDGKTE